MLKRAAAVAAATAAAGAGAGGCSSRRTTGGPVTLDFYTYSTPEFRYLFAQKLIPAFEKWHPGIKVRFNEGFSDMYDGKLLTLIAGKVAPDVFHVVQSNFPSLAARDVPLAIDQFVSGDPEFKLSDLYPQMADAMRYKGKLLGLPSDFSPIVMLYNKALFDRYRVAYPKPGWTWDDFLRISHQLTAQTPDGPIWGCANQPAYNRWPAWVWMAGGSIFNADLTRCTMDSAESIAGFSYYANLSLKEKVAPKPNLLEGEYYQAYFSAGRIGMIAESRYVYKRFLRVRKLDFPWDCAPMPKGKSLATTYIWGGNCIYKKTKHPKEAWQFLKFITGPAGAAVTLDAGNALPPYRPAAEGEVLHPRDKDVPAHDHFFLDAIDYGRVAPFPRQYPEVISAMSGLHESFIGLSTPEQACRQFAATVNEILQGGVF